MAVWFWRFWIFSFLGWGLERCFAAVTRARVQRRRGLLIEPLCPVYGLGILAVLALPLQFLVGWRLYFSGAVITTVVEYLYHWWGEQALGVTFWEYSGVWGNLRGRVCLPFSLAWGLLTVPAVRWVDPAVRELAARISPMTTWLCLLIFAGDTLCTLRFLAVTHDLEALRQSVWP